VSFRVIPQGIIPGIEPLTVSAVSTLTAWGSTGVYTEATVTVTPAAGSDPAQCRIEATGDSSAWEMTERDGQVLPAAVALSALTDALASFSIQPSTTATFKIRFVPTTSGAKACTLTVYNQDGTVATAFSLTGTWSDTFLLECRARGVSLWSPRDYAAGNLSDGDGFSDLTRLGLPRHVLASSNPGEWSVVSDPIGAGHASLSKRWNASGYCGGFAGTYDVRPQRLAIESLLGTGAKGGFLVFTPNPWYTWLTWWSNQGSSKQLDTFVSSIGMYSSGGNILLYRNNGGGYATIVCGSAPGVLVWMWRWDGVNIYHYMMQLGSPWANLGSASSGTFDLHQGSSILAQSGVGYLARPNQKIWAIGLRETAPSLADLQAIFGAM
jgi:hypothetical protein